jgi:hypothetical protein
MYSLIIITDELSRTIPYCAYALDNIDEATGVCSHLLGADISLQSMSEVVVYFAAFKNRKT